ncbi:glycosyl hydrolase family 65 [Pseudonocardia hierapolitana]|uniref:Glycosyl hydrolase family 65 n=1 Tax=Pseudonocardia hierapolitana TaxID=1128676 RepID=A0A561SKD3_9PSEU|nr:glycoside hydrolase N-terminal domain-containing protein [Pseudonocardia hierapolitana]TWF75325.1 glycosyl hydrolase family 65 [Pseudonocardia hierapolitana]
MNTGGPRHGIHDTAPAARWEDAFVSGNGETGVLVVGDPAAERLIVDHHRLVLPNGSRDMAPPAVAGRLDEVRDLVLAGEAEAAQRAFSDGRRLAWTQPFHPGFVIELDRANPAPARDYRRETDFRTGEVGAAWTDVAGGWRSRAFVSRADRVLVYELAGPALDLAVRLSGELPGRPADVGYASAAEAWDPREALLTIRGTYPPGLGAHGFAGVTRLVAVDGPVRAEGDRVVVRGASRLVLLTVLDRGDAPPDEGLLRERLEALPAEYEHLLRRHTALHTPVYERVELDLGVSPADRAQPVGELLAAQGGDPGVSPVLLEAMFHAGRYLLISSTGVLPPRLTGLWLGEWGAAWSGDFTTDANLNLQLAGAGIGALPEAVESLRRLIAGQIEDWRENARAVFGTRGVLAPSRTDGEHGRLFHLDADWPWAMWVAGADWLLFPLLEHWQVTGDDEFLADPLAPWLVEVALFFEDFLTRVDECGSLVLVPSYSPEVGPTGRAGVAAVNATMDIAAARHALSAAVEVCTRLGIEEAAVGRWQAMLKQLPEYAVDARGALAEWAWPGLATPDDHRHVSHLYPVWPLHEITPDGTPELAVAAHRALVLRGDENLSAHGSLHRALCAARLKDADLVEANLGKILGNDMVFRSLMTSHNPGLDVYNADAAHAIPAVVIEALVDSRPGVVELLPALPGRWARGRVRGVRCRNRVTIDELAWDLERSAAHAVLCSDVDVTVSVRCLRAVGPIRRGESLHVEAGEPVRVEFALEADDE